MIGNCRPNCLAGHRLHDKLSLRESWLTSDHVRPVVLHSASTPPVPEPTEMGAVERMRLRAAVLSALVCLALGEVYVPGSVPVDDDAPQVRVGECVPGEIPTDGPDPTDNCNAFFRSQGMSYDAYPIPPVCSCLLYTSPSPRDQRGARMPSSA